jgi:hypothetical protein
MPAQSGQPRLQTPEGSAVALKGGHRGAEEHRDDLTPAACSRSRQPPEYTLATTAGLPPLAGAGSSADSALQVQILPLAALSIRIQGVKRSLSILARLVLRDGGPPVWNDGRWQERCAIDQVRLSSQSGPGRITLGGTPHGHKIRNSSIASRA